jgi:DNA polymerase-3 subunit beta
MLKQILNVNALLFHCAATYAASTEETRYYLNGVFCEPHEDGGVILTATDGHRLLSFRDPVGWIDEAYLEKPDEKGMIIDYGDKFALAKACKVTTTKARRILKKPADQTQGIRLIVERNSDTGHCFAKVVIMEIYNLPAIHDGDLLDDIYIHPQPVIIDGTYPDWRRSVPSGTIMEGPGASYSGKYIGEFGTLANIMPSEAGFYDTHTSFMTIDNRDPSGPALCKLGQWDCVAVIMPMRGPGGWPSLPAWY